MAEGGTTGSGGRSRSDGDSGTGGGVAPSDGSGGIGGSLVTGGNVGAGRMAGATGRLASGGRPSSGGNDLGGKGIGGTKWDLWVGSAGWPVYSYVRTSNVTSATLNIMDFVADLVNQNHLPKSQYVSSVQAGIEEVRKGTSSSTLTISRFYCRIH